MTLQRDQGANGADRVSVTRRIPQRLERQALLYNSESNVTSFPIAWGRRDPMMASFLQYFSSSSVVEYSFLST